VQLHLSLFWFIIETAQTLNCRGRVEDARWSLDFSMSLMPEYLTVGWHNPYPFVHLRPPGDSAEQISGVVPQTKVKPKSNREDAGGQGNRGKALSKAILAQLPHNMAHL